MEHGRVGGIGILPVGLAGDDDADRRLLGLHRVDLNRRSMRAQKLALSLLVRMEEECIVHLARGMPFGEVQRGEIIIVGLDIRPLGDREAEVAEDGSDLVDHLADRVDTPALGGRLPDRQGHVDLLRGEPRGDGRVSQFGAARGQSLGHADFQPVDRRALNLPFLLRHRAERLQKLGNRPLLAEGRDAHGLDGRFVAGSGDFGKKRGFERIEDIHVHAGHRLPVRASFEAPLRKLRVAPQDEGGQRQRPSS